MQLPWVSRLAYEDARLQLHVEEVRSNDILEKYHALKLQGAVPIDEPPEPLPDQPKREPTIVSQVIREQSGGDPRLAAHLRTYAGKLKREGADENQIAYALGQWVSTEPETQVI